MTARRRPRVARRTARHVARRTARRKQVCGSRTGLKTSGRVRPCLCAGRVLALHVAPNRLAQAERGPCRPLAGICL